MSFFRPLSRTFIVLALFALTGCGFFSHGPDKDTVRQILQDQIDPSGKVVIVQSIDSLNAAEQGQQWLVDVNATLLFKKSAEQLAQSLQAPSSGAGMLGTMGQIGLVLQFGNFKAGQTQAYQARLVLLHGSGGWMPAHR